MEKTVWQLPFHPRLPSRAKAFQCFLRGLRAERADYIQKNERARLIFWTGRGQGSARARLRAVGLQGRAQRARLIRRGLGAWAVYSMRSRRCPSFSFFVRR